MEFFIIVVVVGFLIHYVLLRESRKKLQVFYNLYVLSVIDEFLKNNPDFKRVGFWHSKSQKITEIILYKNTKNQNCLLEVGSSDSFGFRDSINERIESGELKLIKRIRLNDYELFSF